VDVRWDLRYGLPFGDCSAQLIFSEHLLEHLSERDAGALIGECFRVLAPSGVIRLGVPDAELYLVSYAERNAEFFAGLRHLGGAVEALETPIQVVNQMFRMGGHHLFAWDFQLLSCTLQRQGFANVKRFAPGDSSMPDLCLDDPERAFETLYVEATKSQLIE
jgi:predicted SAM-dependent methyltransferase